MANVIEFRNVFKSYKKNKALDNLSFTVKSGTFFGFVGRNGAGKSTTINLMANITKKDGGEVSVLGETLSSESYLYKSKVGFLLEKPTYMDKLTSKEYLTFVGKMYGLEYVVLNNRVNELLTFLDLNDKSSEYIETYSAGMKKKTSLAAAVIHDPELLILDEPFEGVDPISSVKIKEMLNRFVAKGRTVFFSSQALEIVEKLSSEIAVIDKGKIICQCFTEDIKNKMHATSLEEVFVSLVGDDNKSEKLSWV